MNLQAEGPQAQGRLLLSAEGGHIVSRSVPLLEQTTHTLHLEQVGLHMRMWVCHIKLHSTLHKGVETDQCRRCSAQSCQWTAQAALATICTAWRPHRSGQERDLYSCCCRAALTVSATCAAS